MTEIWKKISGALGAKAYNLLLSIATLALTARLLGPEGRGQVGAVLAWVALFSTLGHLSLGSVAIRQLALETSAARVGELLGSLLLYTGILTVVGWMLAAGLTLLPGSAVFGEIPISMLAVGFLSLPFLLWEVYGQSLLMGLDQAKRFNRATMLGRSINLVAVYLLVGWLAWGPTGAIVAALFASIVTAAGGVRALRQYALGQVRPSFVCISILTKGALRLHLNAVGTYLFTQSGVLVVNHFHGATATGTYQLAAQLIGVMSIIPNAVSQTMYGVVTSEGPDKSWSANRHVLHRSMLIALATITVAWLIAPYAIPLVAGQEFIESIEYFRWMLPTLLAGMLSAAMAPQWIGRGLFWQASSLTLFVGVCGITVSVLLVPRMGPLGAIYALLFANLVGAIFNVVLYIYCERRTADQWTN